jgi:hypothetical protein
MAYSNYIKEEAFGLYCTGISFDDIGLEMKKRFPEECQKINRHTIAGWEKKYNWQPRKESIMRRTKEKLDARRVSKRAEVIAELDELRDLILGQTKSLRAKSLEGGANSVIALTRMIMDLKGERSGAGKLDGKELEGIIAMIFEVLSEDEKIGSLLQQRQDFILDKISERLETENP